MPYVSTTLGYKYALYDVFISHFCGFVTRRFLFVWCMCVCVCMYARACWCFNILVLCAAERGLHAQLVDANQGLCHLLRGGHPAVDTRLGDAVSSPRPDQIRGALHAGKCHVDGEVSKHIRFMYNHQLMPMMLIHSTCFLMGPFSQIKKMFASTRVIATCIVIGSFVMTLVSAIVVRSCPHNSKVFIIFDISPVFSVHSCTRLDWLCCASSSSRWR